MVSSSEGVDLDSVDLVDVDVQGADKSTPAAAPGQPGQPGQPPAPVVDEAAEWAEFPEMLGAMLAPALPGTADVFTKEKCRAWGEAMAPVARKHGWKPGEFLGWLAPYLKLALATHALVTPTVLLARVAIEKARAEAATRELDRPGGATAT